MVTLGPALWLKLVRTVFVLSMAVLLLGTIDRLLLSGVSRADAAAVYADSSTSPGRPEVNAAQPITVVYSQPPSGTLYWQSSQIGYDRLASDYDQYVWDDFTLSYTYAITEIDWRGEYLANGEFGGITDFIVSLYTSTAFGWQPDVLNPPLAEYIVGSNAGEYPPWTAGPPVVTIHDYQFALPTPFTAEAGIKYWVQIEGVQPGPTDWYVVEGANGSGWLFYAHPGAGDIQYFRVPGDIAFTLSGPAIEPPIVYNHWVYLPLVSK